MAIIAPTAFYGFGVERATCPRLGCRGVPRRFPRHKKHFLGGIMRAPFANCAACAKGVQIHPCPHRWQRNRTGLKSFGSPDGGGTGNARNAILRVLQQK
jgi:hypothetical protein